MMQAGFVSPERTTLVASTHRIFTVQEKSGASDARYDGLKILDAAKKFSHGAVLFDMDGTLVDTAELHFQAWQAVCREQGRDFTRAEFAATFGQRNPDILRKLFGERLNAEEIEALGQRKEVLYRAAARNGVVLLPGVGALVHDLHQAGFIQAIGSSAPHANLELILRLTGIDRFAPDYAIISPDDFYRESSRLIERYHRKGRNLYAITPRFSVGCTDEMMERCRQLKQEHNDCWINTHISENPSELYTSRRQSPDCIDYTAVHEKHGLLGPKFVAGHGVWLSNSEFQRFAKAGAAVAFRPRYST